MFKRPLIALAVCLLPLSLHAQTPAEIAPKLRAGGIDVSAQAVAVSLRPKVRDDRLPNARWGSRGRGAIWTRAAVSALRGPASDLVDYVPADIEDWCPAYVTNNDRLREAFWVGMVSSLAKHESTYRPTVIGGGGRWHGLLQILPSTARLYGCRARSGDALLSGELNLSCGLRIMNKTVRRDGVISRGMRGVAADWGPFHSRSKREDMMAWSNAQGYCKPISGKRPVARDTTTPPLRTPVLSTMGRAPAP